MRWQAVKNILYAAAFAGLLAGLLLTFVQQIRISPLILQAEVYEEAGEHAHAHDHSDIAAEHHHSESSSEPHSAESHDHDSEHHGSAQHEHNDHHDHDWQPANGWERTLYTAAANVSLAIGFGLLLGAAINVKGNANWRSGLLWGLAGYAVFFIAPSLSLPPQLPGSEAAPLANRQLWWLMAVVMTASGLTLLVFSRSWAIKLLGIAMLVIPHFINSAIVLDAAAGDSVVPHAMNIEFIYASAIANAVLWLTLGGLMGLFFKNTAADSHLATSLGH